MCRKVWHLKLWPKYREPFPSIRRASDGTGLSLPSVFLGQTLATLVVNVSEERMAAPRIGRPVKLPAEMDADARLSAARLEKLSVSQQERRASWTDNEEEAMNLTTFD